MLIHFFEGGRQCQVDLDKPIQIGITLRAGAGSSKCFYAPPFETFPVVEGTFIGDTKLGGSINFKNIRLNPHGNGTHTECVGHISKEDHFLSNCLTKFHFIARLISIYPQLADNGDKIICREQLELKVGDIDAEAIVVRTLPNDTSKIDRQYSGTNPAYFEPMAIEWMIEQGIQHLLTDLPSVDREEDGGGLAAHKAFWNYPQQPATQRTITEMIYVPAEIPDGEYLLNIQVPSMDLDASPSGVLLFAIKEIS